MSYEDHLTGMMLESFLQHYRYGAAENIKEKNGMKKRNKELQNAMEKQKKEFQSALERQELEFQAALERQNFEFQAALERKEQELQKIEHSWDFRLGHFLFYIPHKIVGYIRNRKAEI